MWNISIIWAANVTNDARCTRDIKSRIAMAKAALNKQEYLSTSKLDLNLRKKLENSALNTLCLTALQ
jgi:hypothetical protein